MGTPNELYWRRKLSAFLHDSPDHVIDLADQGARARLLAAREWFKPSETARREIGHAASAADRLPWPRSLVGSEVLLRSAYEATGEAFRHPLGRSSLAFEREFASTAEGTAVAHHSRPGTRPEEDARAVFLRMWRFWQNRASDADARFAFLPADSRLPDHTIWNHLSVTSALQGCFGGSQEDWVKVQEAGSTVPPQFPDRPALLLFTVGPAQEFISQARNTRDLWSGSYLLSYLTGTVLARIALEFGPDHILFPNPLGQPILDLLLGGNLSGGTGGSEPDWDAMGYGGQEGRQRLVTPSLPNRLLALLPSRMTEHPDWQRADDRGRTGASRYAASLEHSLRERLCEIAMSVAAAAGKAGGVFDAPRFEAQAGRMFEIHWSVSEWPESVAEVQSRSKRAPGEAGAALTRVLEMVNRMPPAHRDPRCFAGGQVGDGRAAGLLREPAVGWSALYAEAAWNLDAVKSTRAFNGWSTGKWQVGPQNKKDSLTGKEESCLTVPSDEELAEDLGRRLGGSPHLFKPGDLLGAPTLIKRLWHRTWLVPQHRDALSERDFGMPNTRSIAAHEPWVSNGDEDGGSEDDGRYFAVLALDGDNMGAWISGAKCPPLGEQLSVGAREYFAKYGNAGFAEAPRPLCPSFHLQFSELLGNFSLHCARRVVEAFDGRLIYAGGDDVLAMLPADTVIACARALRAAFQGDPQLPRLARGLVDRSSAKRADWRSDRSTELFVVRHPGFVRLTPAAARQGRLLAEPVGFDVAVPGPAADCSVGIAIAHFKSPLQDVVRAAQAAETRAKTKLDRGALAVTTMKRSGEINEWGAGWDRGSLDLYEALLEGLAAERISGRFPHQLIERLTPYVVESQPGGRGMQDAADFSAELAEEIILRELDFVAGRQRGKAHCAEWVSANLLAPARRIFKEPWLTDAQARLRHVIGLCHTAAFVARQP